MKSGESPVFSARPASQWSRGVLLTALLGGAFASCTCGTGDGTLGPCVTELASECGAPCTKDTDCGDGTYCDAKQTCNADCTKMFKCSGDRACSDRGRCGGAGGGGGSGGEGGSINFTTGHGGNAGTGGQGGACGAVTVAFAPQV